MEIMLLLAGLRFRFLSERPLRIDPALNNFITSPAAADITVRVSWDWEHLALPGSPPLGEDALCRYYRQGDALYCLTRGGVKGPVACAVYRADCREILCVLNEKPFLSPPENLGSILRMIPMRETFLRFGVLFLHAAQISWQGRGILFAAPSGTGKTTQARLWQAHRGAAIVCSDRTLIRKADGCWRTYGYPLDGSEPVCSREVNPLGAVVLLEQGPGNGARQLRPTKALPLLMRQAVLDCWSGKARASAMDLLLTMMEEIPVFLLTCTPDERAVTALEQALMDGKVIANGNNF